MPIISKTEARKQRIPSGRVHTILVPRTISRRQANEWLKEHNFRHSDHRVTANFHRFNQLPEVRNATYSTITLPNNYQLVLQYF